MMIIGVAGLGTMGLGIAQVYAAAGYKVLATDAFAPARDSAPARLRAALEPRVAKGALTPEAMEAVSGNFGSGVWRPSPRSASGRTGLGDFPRGVDNFGRIFVALRSTEPPRDSCPHLPTHPPTTFPPDGCLAPV